MHHFASGLGLVSSFPPFFHSLCDEIWLISQIHARLPTNTARLDNSLVRYLIHTYASRVCQTHDAEVCAAEIAGKPATPQ